VQLYDADARVLCRNVAEYLSVGLLAGEGAIVIVTAEHRTGFAEELHKLGVDTRQAESDSRLLWLDAQRTLGRFMMEGQPDWERFSSVVGAAMSRVRAAAPAGLRAYGEMVGVLWTAGQYTAAIRLEEYWNRLLATDGRFTLFCSYPIDVFAKDFNISGVDALLCDHTHLVPSGGDDALVSAVDRAMDECLGERAPGVRTRMEASRRPARAAMPQAEAMILWIREFLPQDADAILALARQYYSTAQVATA
jgi:hypothetical protein